MPGHEESAAHPASQTRSRSNAMSEPATSPRSNAMSEPTTRPRSNAMSEPSTRPRSNAMSVPMTTSGGIAMPEPSSRERRNAISAPKIGKTVADAQNHLGHIRRQNAAKGLTKPIASRFNNLVARLYMSRDEIRTANIEQSKAAGLFKQGLANSSAQENRNLLPSSIKKEQNFEALGAALLLGPGKRHYESREIDNDIKAKALKRAQKGRSNYTEMLGINTGFDRDAFTARRAKGYLEQQTESHHSTNKWRSPISYMRKKRAYRAQFAVDHRAEGEALSDTMQEVMGDHKSPFKAEKKVEGLEKNLNRFNLGAKITQRVGTIAGAGFAAPLGYARKAVTAIGWTFNAHRATKTANKFDAAASVESAKPGESGAISFRGQALQAKSEQNRARSRMYTTKAFGSVFSGLYSWAGIGPRANSQGEISVQGVQSNNFTHGSDAHATAMGESDNSGTNRRTRLLNTALKQGVKQPLKKAVKDRVEKAQYSWLQRNVRHTGHIKSTVGKHRVREEAADALANIRAADRQRKHEP